MSVPNPRRRQPIDFSTGGYLSIGELSTYSGLSPRYLRGALSHPVHPLPHYHVGRRVLVRRCDFDDWIERYKVGGPTVAALAADAIKGL